jgi:predicted GTPase
MEIDVLEAEVARLERNWTVGNYFPIKKKIDALQTRINELKRRCNNDDIAGPM